MASTELANAMEREFLLGEKFLAQGATFGGMVALGGIANVTGLLPDTARVPWQERLRAKPPGPEAIEQVKADCEAEVERLTDIASVGDQWEWEELVLVVGKRVELDLVAELLRFLGHPMDVDVSGADDLIRKIAASKKNAATYDSARRQCARNWGLPIRSPWLGTDKLVSL